MRALRFTIFAGTIAVAGCSSDSSSRGPTGPGANPTPQPAGIQITGVVIGHDSPGAGSPRSATMSIWYETERGGQSAGPALSTSSNGTFTITAPADTRAVRFMAEASGFVQPCLATLRVAGATSYSFDVHLVRESALSQLRTFSFVRSPFVEGLVYETTPAGRRGVRDASIVVDGASGLGLSLADTVSDDQGHFVLCGFEGETSMVLFAVKAGYELATVNLPIGSETAVEIELKR
jgi:hypothetical protein